MNQTSHVLLFGILCFIIGGLAFYTWSTTRALKQQNRALLAEEQVSPSPFQPLETAPIVTPAEEAISPTSSTEQTETGAISGTLGYPSEGIPPMTVYAFKHGELATYYSVKTQQNQSSFTIDGVAPGSYVVVAFLAPPLYVFWWLYQSRAVWTQC